MLCKKENNGIKHVVNECIELKDLRDKLINELNNLDRKIEKLNTLEKNVTGAQWVKCHQWDKSIHNIVSQGSITAV